MLTLPFSNEPIETFTEATALQAMRQALAQVRGEFGQTYPLHIGDRRIVLDETIESVNPSQPTQLIGRASKAGIAHADLALAAAWDAFEDWRRWPQQERSRVMLKAAQLMRVRKRELEAWLVYEIGKNFLEASAEVAEMIDFIEYYSRQAMRHTGGLGYLNAWPAEENESFYMPLGAGVSIAPWNFPMALMTGMTVGAAVVGNTVVCKPAEDTVVSLAKVFEIFAQAGVPPGVMNYLPGVGSEVGAHLVAHPRTRFVNFTGSLATGMRINETAAKVVDGQRWIKRVFLELGGKDAILVDETADLEAASQAVVASAFGYQGQKCSACSRVIAVDSVYGELMDRIVDLAEKFDRGCCRYQSQYGPAV